MYRDAATGKKRIVSAQDEEREEQQKKEEEEEQQRLANKGAYQRMQEENAQRELEEAATMTLARGVEDEKLEEKRMGVIREGDPMAMYAWKVSLDAFVAWQCLY